MSNLIKKTGNAIKAFFVSIYVHRKESHLYWQDYIVFTLLLVGLSVILQKWIVMLIIISLQQMYSFVKAIQQVKELKKKVGEL